MKAREFIQAMIKQHPTLFKDKDYNKSRLKVLDHIFFTIGNGMEWSEDGNIRDSFGERIEPVKKLPPSYFKKPLWPKVPRIDFLDGSRTLTERCCYRPFHPGKPSDYTLAGDIPENANQAWMVELQYLVDESIAYWKNPYRHCNNRTMSKLAKEGKYDEIEGFVKKQIEMLEAL